MSAVLFGSISTLADTSELQREAFNQAFSQHGLDWSWSREDYVALLEQSGGAQRIADFAASRGEDVDAAAVHATKSELFQAAVSTSPPPARDGVVNTIRAAKSEGMSVALVTTTSPGNVTALLAALADVQPSDFDLVVDTTSVDQPQPDKAAYAYAVDRLGEQAKHCVAIEDNLGGVTSAQAAGLACVAFPNRNTAGHDFAGADDRVDALDLATLRRFVGA